MKRIYIILTALATMLVMWGVQSFTKDKTDPVKNTFSEEQLIQKIVAKHVKQIEEKYTAKVDSLNKRCDSLESALAVSDINLKQAKRKSNGLQQKVKQLIVRDNQETDISKRLANCDSIKERVDSLITSHIEQDSLCEAMVTQLHDLAQTKNEAFSECETTMKDLEETIELSLSQQQELADNLNKATKKLKRKTKVNKILAIGAVLVTGAFTGSLLMNPH